MKINQAAIAFGLAAALLLPAFAQTAADAQKQALAKYPELARQGSPMNVKFVELYRQAKAANAPLLNDPRWPLALADQAAGMIAAPAAPPSAPAPGAPPAPAAPLASLTPAAPLVPPARPMGGAPDFGPNVILIDPSMDEATIKTKCDAITAKQLKSQFGSERYAILFKPGAYKANVSVGFYTQVSGLGKLPDDVTITGQVLSDPNGVLGGGNATQNFWRSCENLAIVPNKGTELWAVSQAAPFRRVHVKGNMALSGSGWSSGGYLADSKIDGSISSGSQQQWFSRNTEWADWKGGNWNMVFLGISHAPSGTWPDRPYTTVDKTPVIAEKPFLYVDATGNYQVFVPGPIKESSGCGWAGGQPPGTSIPLSQFYVAHADKDNETTMNDALSRGGNILLTPGIYDLNGPLKITRPNTVVLGLGLATLQPQKGNSAMEVADVSGVKLAGILFDAGPVESPVLLQVGPSVSSQSHADNPTMLYDIFARIGGAKAGVVKDAVVINSNDVIGDHAWLWRADHGAGVGWTVNKAIHGLVVNGANVNYYGLFVEHFQEYQTLWKGENGKVCFYQCEMPYDPTPDVWKNGNANGYPGFKVADTVKTFEGWGLGVYGFFNKGGHADNGMEVPKTPGVKIHHVMTYGKGIGNIINGTSGAKSRVVEYP